MNERGLAERFNQDVDRLLNEAGRTDAGPLPAEYRQALDVARALTTADFSTESRAQQTLRRRLLGQMSTRQGRSKGYPVQSLKLWGLLLRAQLRIVHRDIWAASALVMLVGTAVTLALRAPANSAATLPFVLVAPVVAAAGVAFLYGPAVDPALEIELATPVSPRVVLLARLALVFGFDLGLGLAGSAMLSWLRAEISFWPLVSAWLAPMAFLSALAFLLTILTLEPAAGMLVSLGLWVVHSVARFSMASGTPLPFTLPDLTAAAARPWLWMLALLLGGLALWIAGHEERWMRRQA